MLGGTIGMAICNTLLATTGDYRLIFLVTSALLFLNVLLAWMMIERHVEPGSLPKASLHR